MATGRPIPVTSFDVRPAVAGDAPGLFYAWQRLRQHNAEVDRRVIPAPVDESEFSAGLLQLLGRRRSVALVADASGELAGFVSGSIEENQPDRLPALHATVGYLWVESRFRRMGVGRALFEAVAGWARAHEGVGHFEMAVLKSDAVAAEFWRSIGFAPFIERLWAPLSAPERDE